MGTLRRRPKRPMPRRPLLRDPAPDSFLLVQFSVQFSVKELNGSDREPRAAPQERPTMKGDAKVIAILNEVLKAELTAINQYFLHAEKLMERILLLDGAPNMTDYFKINIGQTLKQQLENDLQLEYTAVKRLNDGIKASVAAGDNGSRELMEKILLDEEHHIDWLEGQLHAIEEMTYENYLAQQLHQQES